MDGLTAAGRPDAAEAGSQRKCRTQQKQGHKVKPDAAEASHSGRDSHSRENPLGGWVLPDRRKPTNQP
ncbi:MAG: hypothetical protein ACFNYI_02495 [Eubacterium sp.]